MKRNTISLILIVYLSFVSINSAFGREYSKHFYGYEVKNTNIREFSINAKNAIEASNDEYRPVPLKEVENAFLYTDKDCTYFVRIYPANHNTNIFLVANERYDTNNNGITEFLKKSGYKYDKLKDKAAIKEYKFDFYKLAREEKLGNFYITPDIVKPLKKGILFANNKLSKYNQKTTVIPYTIDSSPIELTCIDTTGIYDNDAKIAIIRKEYRLKEKTNKFVHGFEYVLTNKNSNEVSISAASDRHINLVDLTTETMAYMDKFDYIDMTCSFPPVLICTLGTSIVGSIPNWIRWAKIVKEATRYSHFLPQDYKLKSEGRMRILLLKHKEKPEPINFTIKSEEKIYNLTF